MFENPRRGRQARNFTTNVPKILVLKSSSEQIFSRKLPLGAPEITVAGNPNAVLANRIIKRIYAVLLANKMIKCIYLCSCVCLYESQSVTSFQRVLICGAFHSPLSRDTSCPILVTSLKHVTVY